MTSHDWTSPVESWLSNGLIGIRLGADGNGKGPTFFDAESYEKSGEEKIVPLENPLSYRIQIEGQPLVLKDPVVYERTLDFRTGILKVRWQQAAGKGQVICEIQTVLHPNERAIAQTITLKADTPMDARVSFPPDIEHADNFEDRSGDLKIARNKFVFKGSDRVWRKAIQVGGRAEPTVFPSVMPVWKGPLSREGVTIFRTVRGTGERATPGPHPGTFQFSGKDSQPDLDYSDPIFHAAKAHHVKAWETDIEIDGPVEDQQAVRSFLFYLRNAIHPAGKMSIAPMGLSSTQYFGHVFWDADIWVFPALALVDPERAAAIPRYRLEKMAQANKNFLEWARAGRPTGGKPLGPLDPRAEWPTDGVKFPWESSVSGKETVPGPSRFQDHITGSVAWSVGQAMALGLVPESSFEELLKRSSVFYGLRTEPNGDGTYSIRGTMSPDESHTGDNDLYTNLLAQWCMNGGTFGQARSGRPTKQLSLPKSNGTFATYDSDVFRSYKQAAAVLAIFPLQYPQAEREAKAMMELFADKVSKNGPAMSDSVHALIWARLGEREKAYETWRKSWQDFTKHPLLLFSEKRSKDATYFTTGAGGCLQTVIFGFLGLRIDEAGAVGSEWTLPLRNGRVLSISPKLPPSWKKVTFRNCRVLGKGYTLEATSDSIRVTPS